MRKVKTDIGDIEVRGITRKELDDFTNDGLPMGRWSINLDMQDEELSSRLFDTVLDSGIAGPNVQIESLTPKDERKLFAAIISETYGSEEEEKNLPTSGSGTQTETE